MSAALNSSDCDLVSGIWDQQRWEQGFPSPSFVRWSCFQVLRADGIAWERLEVSALLKPQGWEQLPGCRVAAGCSCGAGPTRGVPKVCPKGPQGVP